MTSDGWKLGSWSRSTVDIPKEASEENAFWYHSVWVVATQILFMFIPKNGEDSQFDYHIFQMGWNHQLGTHGYHSVLRTYLSRKYLGSLSGKDLVLVSPIRAGHGWNPLPRRRSNEGVEITNDSQSDDLFRSKPATTRGRGQELATNKQDARFLSMKN